MGFTEDLFSEKAGKLDRFGYKLSITFIVVGEDGESPLMKCYTMETMEIKMENKI